jgi:hypothetical protein
MYNSLTIEVRLQDRQHADPAPSEWRGSTSGSGLMPGGPRPEVGGHQEGTCCRTWSRQPRSGIGGLRSRGPSGASGIEDARRADPLRAHGAAQQPLGRQPQGPEPAPIKPDDLIQRVRHRDGALPRKRVWPVLLLPATRIEMQEPHNLIFVAYEVQKHNRQKTLDLAKGCLKSYQEMPRSTGRGVGWPGTLRARGRSTFRNKERQQHERLHPLGRP